MKQLIAFELLSFLIAALSGSANAQGCSDAGFCTAGALQHNIKDSLEQSSVGLSLTSGAGEQGVAILILQVEWKQQLHHSWDVEIKLPYYVANGSLGTHSGPGDPIITATRSWGSKREWETFATIGARFSLTDAGASDSKGRALPMPYQQGLGTTDLICGLSAQYRHWLFLSAGYQQPIVQYNSNGYLNQAMPLEEPEYNAYFDSRKLVRRADVLFRLEGSFTRRHWMLSAGPLLIYHLGKDKITDLSGQENSISGSEGLTLNLAAKLDYATVRSHWELGCGTPFIVREMRPDGLTREWVLALRYKYILR
jgi:hypothetical protein